MFSKQRTANLMNDDERRELIESGWHAKVVESLADRGFRPCKPDLIAARSGDFDIHRSLGFLRQTSTPHLYITVCKDQLPEVVMERIDTAIYECGHRHGHGHLAGLFMRFFDQCKAWQPAPSSADFEKRLSEIEAQLANGGGLSGSPPPLAGGRCPRCEGRGWCMWRSTGADHNYGEYNCPDCGGTGQRSGPANAKLTDRPANNQ